jgi:hypothetical protein
MPPEVSETAASSCARCFCHFTWELIPLYVDDAGSTGITPSANPARRELGALQFDKNASGKVTQFTDSVVVMFRLVGGEESYQRCSPERCWLYRGQFRHSLSPLLPVQCISRPDIEGSLIRSRPCGVFDHGELVGGTFLVC